MYFTDDVAAQGALLDTATPEELTLTQGLTYYIDCQVSEATPDPTVNLEADSVFIGEGSSSAPFSGSDLPTAATLAAVVVTKRVSIVASHAMHCGRRLSCVAFNTANTLTGTDSVAVGVDVIVLSK